MADPQRELPTIEIRYCTRCRWLLRAAWLAQELLSTFEEELGGASLRPDASGGVFRVHLDGELLFCREREGHLPDSKELKRLVRDRIAPSRDLGHVDA